MLKNPGDILETKKKNNLRNWILGNLICSLGIAFATKSAFGLSMCAAPPYILHIWLRDSLTWFSQGTAEYVFEALLLAVMCIIIRKFEAKYLLTFLEAVFCGFILDTWLRLLGGNGPFETLPMRVLSFFLGITVTALGVAFFFRTTMPLQVYDLMVVKVSEAFGIPQGKVKPINDLCMLILSLAMAILLTGRFTGIGIGTFATTLLNAPTIAFWGRLIDKYDAK